jgi:hypothetical protein
MWCQATSMRDEQLAAIQGLHRDALYVLFYFALVLE